MKRNNKYKKRNNKRFGMFNRKVLDEILKGSDPYYLKTPKSLLLMPFLPSSASAIFNYIMYLVLLYDKSDSSVTISQEEFSFATGISKSTVKRQLKVLQTCQLIQIKKQNKININGSWKTPVAQFCIPADIANIVKNLNFKYLETLEANGNRGNLRIYQVSQFYKRNSFKIWAEHIKSQNAKSNTFITDMDTKFQWEKFVLLDQEYSKIDAYYTEGKASREELLVYLDSCGYDFKQTFLDYEKVLGKLKPHHYKDEFIPYERVSVYAAAAIGDLMYYESQDLCPTIENPSRFFKVQLSLKKYKKIKHQYSTSKPCPLAILRILKKNQGNSQIGTEDLDITQKVNDKIAQGTHVENIKTLEELLILEDKKIESLKQNFEDYLNELSVLQKQNKKIHNDFINAKTDEGRLLFLKDIINSESSELNDSNFAITIENLIGNFQAKRQSKIEYLKSLLPRDAEQEAEEITPIESTDSNSNDAGLLDEFFDPSGWKKT